MKSDHIVVMCNEVMQSFSLKCFFKKFVNDIQKFTQGQMEQIPGETIAGTTHLHDSHQAAWGKREEEGKGSPVTKIIIIVCFYYRSDIDCYRHSSLV